MQRRWQTPTTSRNRGLHHDLLLAVWTRQEKNIVKLKNVIKSCLNHMTRWRGVDQYHHETYESRHAATSKKYICSQDEIDQQKYTAFGDERVNMTEVNLWARVKKVEPKTWKSARKPMKHKLADKTVEMKDDRSLFTRIMSVARSRPEYWIELDRGQLAARIHFCSTSLVRHWGKAFILHRQEQFQVNTWRAIQPGQIHRQSAVRNLNCSWHFHSG